MLRFDGVDAPVTPWIAAQQPPSREHEAPQYAEFAHRLDRVLRARGVVLAARGQQGGDKALVAADRRDGRAAQDAAHDFSDPACFSRSSVSALCTPARPSRSASSRASGRATTTRSWPSGMGCWEAA